MGPLRVEIVDHDVGHHVAENVAPADHRSRDEVSTLRRECRRHRLVSIGALERDVEASAPQLAHDEQGIVFDVLHDQRPEPPLPMDYGFLLTGAVSFRTSQYKPSWRTASLNCTKSTGLRT